MKSTIHEFDSKSDFIAWKNDNVTNESNFRIRKMYAREADKKVQTWENISTNTIFNDDKIRVVVYENNVIRVWVWARDYINRNR